MHVYKPEYIVMYLNPCFYFKYLSNHIRLLINNVPSAIDKVLIAGTHYVRNAATQYLQEQKGD